MTKYTVFGFAAGKEKTCRAKNGVFIGTNLGAAIGATWFVLNTVGAPFVLSREKEKKGRVVLG